MISFFIIMLMLSIVCLVVAILGDASNTVVNVIGLSGVWIFMACMIYIVFFYDNQEKQSIADRYEQLINPSPSLESRIDNLRKCMEKCIGQKVFSGVEYTFSDVEHTIEIVEDFEKDYKKRIDI